jgi:hypothetical protein
MALPPSFLQHVEQHPCFTGCYSSTSGVRACLDPNNPLVPLVVVSCQDCYAHFGVPQALLPPGTDSYRLAEQLTQHMRKHRGFALSVSGYWTKGPGFWFSVAYYPCGIFLIHGERSRPVGSDLDQLFLAFHHGVLTPPDPRMIDPKQYAVQTVYGNFVSMSPAVKSKQDLLASPQIRAGAQSGWLKLTLAEFLPLSTAASGGAGKPGTKPAAKTLKVGDICPVCGAVVRERPLLNGSFVGCMC